jgi:streptogrisin C
MRPFPAISVIGTGALAFGLVFAPGANAAPVPASPAPQGEATMLEALARDLGLTPPGAETLLEAQEEALKTDAEATQAAGDAYGYPVGEAIVSGRSIEPLWRQLMDRLGWRR